MSFALLAVLLNRSVALLAVWLVLFTASFALLTVGWVEVLRNPPLRRLQKVGCAKPSPTLQSQISRRDSLQNLRLGQVHLIAEVEEIGFDSYPQLLDVQDRQI